MQIRQARRRRPVPPRARGKADRAGVSRQPPVVPDRAAPPRVAARRRLAGRIRTPQWPAVAGAWSTDEASGSTASRQARIAWRQSHAAASIGAAPRWPPSRAAREQPLVAAHRLGQRGRGARGYARRAARSRARRHDAAERSLEPRIVRCRHQLDRPQLVGWLGGASAAAAAARRPACGPGAPIPAIADHRSDRDLTATSQAAACPCGSSRHSASGRRRSRRRG
jgi:hypothetical protein